MERHTAQAGNQPVAAAEEARRATTGIVATFMVLVGECLRKLGTRLMGYGHVGILVCLGNEDLGNAVGREVNLKDLDTCGVPHGTVCLNLRWALRTRRGIDDHKNRKRLTRQG
jgi:hypothetical protein